MNKTETIEDFYQLKLNWMPDNLGKEMGHFNVFKLEDFAAKYAKSIPYNRKDFFKISLIIGENRVYYADKTIEINKQALFFVPALVLQRCRCMVLSPATEAWVAGVVSKEASS